jgi:hypothetical protein
LISQAIFGETNKYPIMKNQPQKKTIAGAFYNSSQVLVLLRTNPSELEKLRMNDDLHFFAIGGKIFYAKRDVEWAMNKVTGLLN